MTERSEGIEGSDTLVRPFFLLASGLNHSLRQDPPTQLSPALQKFPQRPQFEESLMKSALLLHDPMHFSYPGAQSQNPPVQLSLKEQRFPQRPQLAESFTKLMVSTQLPLHQSCPAEHEPGPIPGVLPGGVVVGGFFCMTQDTRRTKARETIHLRFR